jgi:hypothetical protein
VTNDLILSGKLSVTSTDTGNPASSIVAPSATTADLAQWKKGSTVAMHLDRFSNLLMGGNVLAGAGLGVWGHAAPGAQPATPVTLADVIALIRAYGLSA